MAKLFIHITSGPELPNKVSLGLLVAAASDKEKHDVKVFFAADGVHLLNCKEKGQIVGLGTGDIKDHLDELKNSQTKIYVSRLSANGRGYDESLLEGYNAEFATPEMLVNLSIDADSVLCY